MKQWSEEHHHMIINKYSIKHWTIILEEEGHQIFINLENKYKYTFSSSLAPRETSIWFCCFSSPRNSTSKLYNTRRKILGQRCGQREIQILQHKNEKNQVSSHGPPYPSLYDRGRFRGEEKVVTTEGVSCITTQTTWNSKDVFFDIFKRRTRVCRNNSHVHEKAYMGC